VIVSLQMTHERPQYATQDGAGFKLAGLASSAHHETPAEAQQTVSAPQSPSQPNPVRLTTPDFSLARSSEPARKEGGLGGVKKPASGPVQVPVRGVSPSHANAIQPQKEETESSPKQLEAPDPDSLPELPAS
jgi:hypothetical protein